MMIKTVTLITIDMDYTKKKHSPVDKANVPMDLKKKMNAHFNNRISYFICLKRKTTFT